VRDSGAQRPLAEFLHSHVSLKRLGRPEEVARLVAFLASDAGSYCTGGSYPIDGGIV
jgi:NAD(P)-dependent dehydrogenase (short-subunit alcohol dehydrogenase family)